MSEDRTAVVTGGEGELAQGIARSLQMAGYRVLAPGRLDLDVCNEECVKTWFDNSGPVDLLVNNAGCLEDASVLRVQMEQWDRIMETNLRGSFLCARAVLPGMLKRRDGHILQIGSYSARSGPTGQSVYAASKAALIGLTQSLAKEGGRRGVRSNLVMPGYLETKFTRDVPKEARAAHLSGHVLGRFNTVEDAARFVVTLDAMQNVSGQVFQLDSRIGKWA